jgi:hypothetical protein
MPISGGSDRENLVQTLWGYLLTQRLLVRVAQGSEGTAEAPSRLDLVLEVSQGFGGLSWIREKCPDKSYAPKGDLGPGRVFTCRAWERTKKLP